MQKPQVIIKPNLTAFPKQPNLLDYDKFYKDFTWEKASKEMITFFPDGTLNAAYNMIDRHVENGKGDKTALLFTSSTGEKETYTFKDFKKLSDKFANVLDELNVEK